MIGRDFILRKLTGFWKHFIDVICIALVLFQLYTAGFGIMADIVQRSIHLCFVLVMIFLLKPPSKRMPRDRGIPIYDAVLAALSAACCINVLLTWQDFLWSPLQWLGGLDKFFALCTILLVLEASRRSVGIIFPILGGVFFIYAYFGEYFPGVWAHKQFDLNFIFQTFYHTTNGIWGQMLSISSTMLAMFGIFGAMLSATGGAKTFIKLSQIITGKSIGGPGKVSLVASGLFGMISGSAVANVVATGTFTIPLMKKAGYDDEWAGAISAVGSTGGQIMPPIMGAAAFVMSQILAVPYLEIAISAIIPALLYYFGAFVATHYISRKKNIGSEEIKEKINIWEYLIIFIPISIFIFFLVRGYSVTNAAFYGALVGLLVTIIIFFTGEKPRSEAPEKTKKLLYQVGTGGAFSIIDMAGLLAGAQITITLISMSGFAVKLSDLIIRVGETNLFLCLLLSMVVCVILGMGVPTTAAYVLGSAILCPALIGLGLQPLVAHMFVFFFAALSAITPPVCSAVFISAGLAEGNWLKTGFLSCLLALPVFVIPYTFAYNGALLLQGTFWGIASAVVTALAGVFLIGVATAGYLKRELKMPMRIILIGGGLLMLIPNNLTSAVGAVIAVAAIFVESRTFKNAQEVSGNEV